MIEEVRIWKFAAERRRLHKGQLRPRAFSIVICAHRRANCTQSRISDAAELHCGDALDEQPETVSAQVAPGLSRSLQISLASRGSNIGALTS